MVRPDAHDPIQRQIAILAVPQTVAVADLVDAAPVATALLRIATVGMAPLTHVIFDLDGTIVDNSATMRRAFQEAFLANGGIGEAPFAGLVALQGQPFGTILAKLGLPQTMEPIFSHLSRSYVGLSRPAEGIAEVLADLRNGGVQLSVASGKSRERARWVLDHFGLLGFFGRVVGSDDVTHGKPAPDMVLRCIAEAGVAPAETMMVGDAWADYSAARAAGIAFGLAGWFPHAVIDGDQVRLLRSPVDLYGLVRGGECVPSGADLSRTAVPQDRGGPGVPAPLVGEV